MKIEMVSVFNKPDMVKSIVSVYQEVFGGEPWNEGYKCPVCGSVFSLAHADETCPICKEQNKHILLVEYWTKSKVTSDFYNEMKKPESLCLIAKESEKIIGFIWGYQISINQEIDTYLEAPELHKIESGEFFYLDDVAVLPQYQGKGIGTGLIKQIIGYQSQNRIMLRTLDNSTMFYLTKKIGGKTVLSISRDRVIMTLPL